MERAFDLVLATVGRFSELDAFLHSLTLQEYKNFTCIIVDQNSDEHFLLPLLEKYGKTLTIVYLRSPKGLSRARNVGLKHCTGDVVCFPDDDCLYPPGLLKKVNATFDVEKSSVLVGKQISLEAQPHRKTFWERNRMLARGQRNETVRSLFIGAPSITLFFTRESVARTGLFDESLGSGAGTPWGSGEDTDYVVRACKNGCVVRRCPQLEIRHPDVIHTAQSFTKARAYGRGRGRLLRKHNSGIFFCAQNVISPLLKGLLLLPNWTAAAYHCHMALGRVEGLFSTPDGL
ncbi:MAG: glycosyltransferase [Desulfovibrio sp.]|jgi:glycosyltransferase involved in cell wall biosynthesis|nr:glycosyltransferase [Desulfovibrio sp.]